MRFHIMSGPHQGASIEGESGLTEHRLPDPDQAGVSCRYSVNTPDAPVGEPDGPEVQLHFVSYVPA